MLHLTPGSRVGTQKVALRPPTLHLGRSQRLNACKHVLGGEAPVHQNILAQEGGMPVWLGVGIPITSREGLPDAGKRICLQPRHCFGH